MARTTQTRKRSGGVIRRRPMKRSRRTKRKAWAVNKQSQVVSASVRQGGRMMRRRAYRGLLWRSSIMLPKYGYQAAATDSLNTPANVLDAYFKVLKMLPGFSTASNFHNRDGTDFTGIHGKILLRGGMEKLTISHESSENVHAVVYIIWVKPGATPPASSTLAKNTPIINTASDLGNESYKVLKRFDLNLEYGGGTVSVFHKFKIKRYDLAQWGIGADCLHWVVAISNNYSSTAVGVTTVQESNGSVCVDVST